MKKIRVGVIGAAGLSAGKLLGLLARHPAVEWGPLVSESSPGAPISQAHPQLLGIVNQNFSPLNETGLAGCDVVFSCKKHGESFAYVRSILDSGVRFIDLSGDFRLKDPRLYDTWYGLTHAHPDLLAQAVYGMPEVYRNQIREARLVANPGCYTTASILAIRPFLPHGFGVGHPLIVHAISGVSGAGRAAKEENLFISVDSNIRSYRIGTHQHTPEIEQETQIPNPSGVGPSWGPTNVLFVPHVGPYQDGIMATIYIPFVSGEPAPTQQKLEDYLRQAYEGHPFVRIRPASSMPQISQVVGTNFCDIGVTVDPRTDTIVVVSCIDNLIKGAAGQAVQNMNLMFGYPETEALL